MVRWPDRQQYHCVASLNWPVDRTSSTGNSSIQQLTKNVANIHQWYKLPASVAFVAVLCSSHAASARQQYVAESHGTPTPALISGNCSTATWWSAVTENGIGRPLSMSLASQSDDRGHSQPIELLPRTLHAHNTHSAHLVELPAISNAHRNVPMSRYSNPLRHADIWMTTSLPNFTKCVLKTNSWIRDKSCLSANTTATAITTTTISFLYNQPIFPRDQSRLDIHRLVALPVVQPIVSKHWRDKQ